jgi:hypothetical protein
MGGLVKTPLPFALTEEALASSHLEREGGPINIEEAIRHSV